MPDSRSVHTSRRSARRATPTRAKDALIQRLESRLLLSAVNLSGASELSGSASGTPHPPLAGAQVVAHTASPDSVGQLTGFSAAAASTSQISLTWNAVSGATSYDIYRGTSSNGENSTPIATGIAGTSFTDIGLNADATYYYTAAAVDSSGPGAQSAEASATPMSSDMGVYDDTNSAIIFSQGQNGDGLNGWDTSSDSADFGGGEHSSNAYSGSFVINFQGTDFEWMGEKGPDFGIANLYIDGQLVGTADSYNPTVLHQQVLYSVSGLADGVHSFEAQIGDYPSPAANPASSGWEQSMDAFATSGTPLTNLPEVSAAHSPVTQTGTWFSGANDLFGNYAYTNQVGATLNYSFNGSGVEVFGHPEGEDGIMNVYVDGSEAATVDEFNPLLDSIEDDANDDQLMYAIDGLPAGNHTLEIQVANGHDPNAVATGSLVANNPGYYTQIDGFVALPSATLPAPTGLTATTVSDSQINLSWNPVSSASSYDVYRSTTSGGEGSTPVATVTTGTSTSDEGLYSGVTYYYTVAGVSGGNAGLPSTEASATTSGGGGGSLTGAEATAAASYNLTTLGTSDWAHWGRGGNASNFDHDATGGSQISNVTKLGPGSYGGYTYGPRNVIWTNGTPTASDSGDDGYLWANNAIGAGYSFTVPASTTSRTLDIYLGGNSAGGTLTATLSDYSATPYTVSVSGSANFQDLVSITYIAANAGQTLTITYDKTTTIGAASGSVDLIAAWLAGPSVPAITTNPQSQSVTSGTPVSFTAAATGSPTPAVQWQVSTNAGSSYSTIAGATSTTLSIGAATVSEAGYEYEAIFTNSGGTTTTTPATLTVTPSASPTVTTNPQSQSVASGVAVTFTAAATGSPAPTIQWELSTNGGSSFATISGATSTTLSIGTANVSETGNEYEAIFSNSGGTTTTTPATLTVTPSALPTVTTNPQSQSVTSGTPVSFSAAATGTPTPSVQWELSTNGGGSFSTIAGATSTTLSIGTATVSETGFEYEAIFSNSAGTTATTAATLTVIAAPTITTNPASQSVAAGTAVSFSAAATGVPTPTVQWELSINGGTSFATIAGATSTTLSIGTATVSKTGYEYEAIFANSAGTAATTAATLTVTQPSGGSLSGAEATAAASYNLTALGTSDWAHWGRGGSAGNFDHDASGGSQISNVTKLGPGNYGGYTYSARSVTWTNGTPTASDSADHGYIWANNAIGAGYSFTVPASTTARTLDVYLGGSSAGGTLTATLSDNSATPYTVSVSGSANFQDLVAITYNAASAGKTLTITYDKTTTIGSAGGSVDLIAAWLAGPSTPAITANPQTQSVTSGTPVTFTAAAAGSPTPTVQWQVSTNGASSYSTIAGATSTTLSIGAASVSETGYEYEAIFSNSGGTTTTTPATLTVTPSASPTVTTNPQSQSVASGVAVTFTAAATGSPTPTIQWELSTNGGVSFAPISGATSTTLSIGTATVSEKGYEYQAIFTNTVGTAATSAATLTVTQPSGGSLVGSYSTAAASYNLTTLGTADWAHWGRGGTSSNFDHDKSGGSQISNVTKLGPGSYGGYTYSGRNVTWTNGSPTATDSADHGYIWANNAIGAGYSFTVPASTTSHTLYIYLGGASSGGTLTAHLSGSSANNYTATISGTGNYQDVVAITYNAASAGQTLTITWAKSQTIGAASGSVDLIAAWLQ